MAVQDLSRDTSISRDRTGQRRRYGLLVPAFAVLFVGLMLPLCIVVVYSFLTPGPFGGVVWSPQPDAYVQFLFDKDLFDDSLIFQTAYLEIFGRSFAFAAVATVVTLAVGFPTAWFIVTQPPRRRFLLLFLLTVPYWVNLLIRTLALLFILRDEGPLNTSLIATGLADAPLELAYTRFAILLGLIYSYLPFIVLPIYAALDRLDMRLVEAAHDLYASRWRVMFGVVVPLARPGIVAGCLLVFIPSIGSYLAPDILGGGRELLAGNLIAQQFQGSRNWPFGSAAAVILMSTVLIGLLIFVRQQTKFGPAAIQ